MLVDISQKEYETIKATPGLPDLALRYERAIEDLDTFQEEITQAREEYDDMDEEERRARLDAIARAMTDLRPDLAPKSLDEWILEHAEKLTEPERRAASAILALYPEYGGD